MDFSPECDTYLVSANAYLRKRMFQSDRMALLMIGTLYKYRDRGFWRLHEFVVMPDPIHVLLTLDLASMSSMKHLSG